MPNLNQQPNAIQYVSMVDFCNRIDQIPGFQDKLAFATHYLLDHGRSNETAPDYSIEEATHIARMKIAEASVKEKKRLEEAEDGPDPEDLYYSEHPEVVDPYAENQEQDAELEEFMGNPGGYLKNRAIQASDAIGNELLASEEEAQKKTNFQRLAYNIFTDEFNPDVFTIDNKPAALDIKVRMECKFGGRDGLEQAYQATKPGFFSRMFGTSSVASRNLDMVYQAFNNPNHALYGNKAAMEKAAAEYLRYKIPNWTPESVIPEETYQFLDATEEARTRFAINMLESIKEEKAMEEGFVTMVGGNKNKKVQAANPQQANHNAAEQEEFQNQIKVDLQKEEQLIDDEAEAENDLELSQEIEAPKAN